MFTSSRCFALVVIAFAAVACTNSVDGQKPAPGRTDSAQTAQGSQTSQGSQGSQTTQGSGGTSAGTATKNTTCPEIDVPACASTDELVTGVDEDGCSYAYCKPNSCPPIDVPQCAPGQGLKYTTDENGCTFADCE